MLRLFYSGLIFVFFIFPVRGNDSEMEFNYAQCEERLQQHVEETGLIREVCHQVCDIQGAERELCNMQETLERVRTWYDNEDEEQFYALAAAQYSRELQCSADFANGIGEEQADGIIQQIQQARDLAQTVSDMAMQMAAPLATRPAGIPFHCPEMDYIRGGRGWSSGNPT